MNEPDSARKADPTPEVHVDPAALAGNPFERKASWRNAFRATGSRGWAAAALAIGVLVLGYRLQPGASSDTSSATNSAATIDATSPDGVAHLTAADPRALRDQIVSDLRTAGVQPSPYEQLGINGIDADLPRPLTPEVRAALDKHHIPVPPNGTLRIEIATQ
jgi:hypothetical protein